MANRKLDMASEENKELLSAVFGAKRVPLPLLGSIKDYREFHRADYPAVEATVKAGVKLREFDFYFEYVLALVQQLEPLWNV